MISQREERRLRKRVDELETVLYRQKCRWAADFPGGTHLGTISMPERGWLRGRIEAARMLNHAVVVTVPNSDNNVEFYALPLL